MSIVRLIVAGLLIGLRGVVVDSRIISSAVLLVSIEVVEEKVVVFDTVFEMLDNLLFFVYLDSETALVVEDVFVVVHVELTI